MMLAQAASLGSSAALARLLAKLMSGEVTSIRINLLIVYDIKEQLNRHHYYGQFS